MGRGLHGPRAIVGSQIIYVEREQTGIVTRSRWTKQFATAGLYFSCN
jgi:hypothetical protein